MNLLVSGNLLLRITLLALSSLGASPRSSSYDIRHYELDIRPDLATRTLNLRTSISIDNPGLERVFDLGLNDWYEFVSVATSSTPVSIERSPGQISIIATQPSNELSVVLELRGKPTRSADEKRHVFSDSSLFLIWSDRFYPIDFDDWATLKTRIALPQGFQAIAPGRVTAIRERGAEVEYEFETSGPVVCFSVLADSRWVRTEREINGLPMQTLLYRESQKYSEQIFFTSSRVLEFYSKTYCSYPFDRFSFVTIEGIRARRAFPGFIGYSPKYLEKEFTTTGHDAHETALLWWFYTIRGRGPGSFQWTEGFGDYAEFLYDEAINKPIPEVFQYFKEKYLEMPTERDVPYTELSGSTPQEIVHGKYPWLLHLLRYVVGDSSFRQAMQSLFTRFCFRTFTMSEFVSTLEESCDRSLGWWRKEWLERKGVPNISFRSEIQERVSGDYRVTVHLEQIGEIYHLPIEIGIQTSTGMRLEKVYMLDCKTTASFLSDDRPIDILLDPNGWVLMKEAGRKPEG